MFNPESLLGSIVGQALGGVFGGRRSRASSLFSTGNIAGKAALGMGALGIAMAAYEHYQGNRAAGEQMPISPMPPLPQSSAPAAALGPIPLAPRIGDSGLMPPPPPPAVDLSNLSEAAATSVLLIRAMIAAAGADATIDDGERQRILARSADGGIDAQTRAFLEAELAIPKSADEIAAMTPPALVNQVYAASLLALDVDNETERNFLARLAAALGLSDAAREEIHSQLR